MKSSYFFNLLLDSGNDCRNKILQKLSSTDMPFESLTLIEIDDIIMSLVTNLIAET